MVAPGAPEQPLPDVHVEPSEVPWWRRS
jgi:hypothetical protein